MPQAAGDLGQESQGKVGRFPQIWSAPVYPSLFSLKSGDCCLASWLVGMSHTSLEGVRLWAGTANTCPQGPGKKHRGGLGVVLEGTVETVAKEKAGPG